MKKLISLALAVLTLALVLAAPVSAAPDRGSYGKVPMFIDGIEMDGKIDEAYTEFGLKIGTVAYPGRTSDTKVDLYLLHDGEYLYVAYDVKEAYAFDPAKYDKASMNASGAWKLAGTELHIDWANKGDKTTCAKLMMLPTGDFYGSMGASGKESTYVKEFKTSYDVAAKTYVLEIKMPFCDGADVGKDIGFFPMITSNKDNAAPAQDYILCTKINDGDKGANNPAVFYNVTLSDEVVAFPEEVKAPAASAATFDGLAVLAVVAALSGAGVVVSKRK